MIWFYKEWQPIYDLFKQILPPNEFSDGIDNETLEKVQASEKKPKRTIKYLLTCKHTEIISRIITKSPDITFRVASEI